MVVNGSNPRSVVSATVDRAVYGFDGEFCVVAHVLFDDLARGLMRYESWRVLGAMLAASKRGTNRWEGTQAELARRLGMHAPQVARAFSELKEAGYIVRVLEPGGLRFWYVDARRAFHGGAKRHGAALAKQRRQRDKDRRSNVVAISGGVAA